MSDEQKNVKHIGEQSPLNQNPSPADNNANSNGGNNVGNSENPIKPQETQKGFFVKK